MAWPNLGEFSIKAEQTEYPKAHERKRRRLRDGSAACNPFIVKRHDHIPIRPG
jgi:hypothetical protein